MNFFFLIPARSSSKRVKDKNLFRLKNRKLINFTLDSLKKIKKKNFVFFISTDSKKIITEVKNNYKFINTHLRPKHLAKDNSKIEDLIKYLKNKNFFKDIDYLILLSPCSPLRTSDDIMIFIKKIIQKKPDVCISVKELEKPIDWSLKLDKNLNLIKIFNKKVNIKNVFVPNGAFYAFNMKKKLNFDNFYSNKVIHHLMDRFKSLDVDVMDDLKQLKLILK